jgi:hypothetical protein
MTLAGEYRERMKLLRGMKRVADEPVSIDGKGPGQYTFTPDETGV